MNSLVVNILADEGRVTRLLGWLESRVIDEKHRDLVFSIPPRRRKRARVQALLDLLAICHADDGMRRRMLA